MLLGFGLASPAQADITVAAKQVSLPGLRLHDMTARISADPTGGLHLQMQAAQADMAALGWRHVGLRLDGRLQRDAQRRWLFDGRVQLRGAPGGALGNAHMIWSVNPGADTLQVEVQQDKALASAWLPLDQPSHAQIRLRQLPAGWLQGVLDMAWSGRLLAGRVDADLALDVDGANVQSSGQFALDDVGFDTPGGTSAGQVLSGNGRFGFDRDGDGSRIIVEGRLTGGALALGPLQAKLPNHPVLVDVNASAQHGALNLNRLRVDDADALQLDGAMAFDAKGRLQTLKLDHFRASFPLADQRYGVAWQSVLGLHDVRMVGRLSGTLDLRRDGLHAFTFATDGLDLVGGDGHFVVNDLRGGLDWSAQGNRPATTLAWQGMQYYRIPIAEAQSHWQSRDGSLSLLQPLAVPVLGGQLRLTSLEWRPAAQGQRVTASLAVTGVDMSSLSHALDWPVIPGTLGGAIPALRWIDDRLELDGSLSADVFGGVVQGSHLSLQQPFGDVPVLVGDFKLDQLDLAAVTSVFDIGSITGKLSGSVDGLRLVDWSPVAFQASLLADGGGRISQRAVNNLALLSGGGVASGLQRAMLKLFKHFDYKRIGLSCTLQDAICQMGGLSGDQEGYTLVEGSGLPRLQLIGHQTRVDWPTLQRRLREAASGHTPVAH